MATITPLIANFISFLILITHLGCFLSTSNLRHRSNKRKPSSLSLSSDCCPSRVKLKSHKAFSSAWSFLKRIFPSKPSTSNPQPHPTTLSANSSARSSQHSSVVSVIAADSLVSDPPRKRRTPSRPDLDIAADHHFFRLRNDIYPCPVCGEIFLKSTLLDQHQAVKHAVSELVDGDSGKNIVRIIFKTGWPDKLNSPNIHRVLKIHNSPKILTRFEEYRESVKSKAARNGAARLLNERCLADGNELLRFHCSTYLCELGQNGNSSVCNHQYCSVCGIIRSGFSPKMDGISTLSTSWRAHLAIPEELEEEFKFMHVKRAMLVCRVIAGRVGGDQDVVDKEDQGFDSLAGRGGGTHARWGEEEELLVFNPRAVLPCFVIIYTV